MEIQKILWIGIFIFSVTGSFGDKIENLYFMLSFYRNCGDKVGNLFCVCVLQEVVVTKTIFCVVLWGVVKQ